MTTERKALTGTAFATLLLIAFMMAGNHVAARFAEVTVNFRLFSL